MMLLMPAQVHALQKVDACRRMHIWNKGLLMPADACMEEGLLMPAQAHAAHVGACMERGC
jgi:hypothetical protein